MSGTRLCLRIPSSARAPDRGFQTEPNRRAFTLLEMLVAMALTSILAGTLYACLHSAFRGRRSVERALGPMSRMAASMEIIRADLASTAPPRGILAAEFLAENVEGNDGEPSDVLLFHRLAVDQVETVPPSPVVRIEYAIAEDDENGEWNLVRRTTVNLLAPEAQEPTEETICRNVLSFDVYCFDGTDWQESWDSTVMGDVLPLAIEITLAVRRDDDDSDRGRDEQRAYTVTRVFAPPCATPPEQGSGTTNSFAGGPAR